MPVETSSLSPASDKKNLRWRETALTLMWLRSDGPVEVAHTLADKRRIVASCRASDRVLALRAVQFPPRQEVLVVDDIESVRVALTDHR
jgi:hypothetical protein